MGTNYYWIKDPCGECGRGYSYHIGKSSGGWEFSFRGHEDDANLKGIRSLIDWQCEFTQEGRIEDEYGRHVSEEDFLALVKAKQGDGANHVRIALRKDLKSQDLAYIEAHPQDLLVQGWDHEEMWLDSQGYGFQLSEFS